MHKNITLSQKQLAWLEEYPDYFVEVIQQPSGVTFDSQVTPQVAKVRTLPQIISEHESNNLWRSWSVYKDQELEEELGPIPLIFDIDDESPGSPNLHNAYRLTAICVEGLLQFGNSWGKTTEDQIRVVFSGKKGFHIEMKPSQPVNANNVRRELIELCREKEPSRDVIKNQFFGYTSIDVFHEHVRLTGSLNSWVNESNNILSRRVIQMSVLEFGALRLEGILKNAEAKH